jgi:hypothetical protein
LEQKRGIRKRGGRGVERKRREEREKGKKKQEKKKETEDASYNARACHCPFSPSPPLLFPCGGEGRKKNFAWMSVDTEARLKKKTGQERKKMIFFFPPSLYLFSPSLPALFLMTNFFCLGKRTKEKGEGDKIPGVTF